MTRRIPPPKVEFIVAEIATDSLERRIFDENGPAVVADRHHPVPVLPVIPIVEAWPHAASTLLPTPRLNHQEDWMPLTKFCPQLGKVHLLILTTLEAIFSGKPENLVRMRAHPAVHA
jgi:hypothetical protein